MWKAQALSLSLSHCGPILTFMMKIVRDTREKHRVKFLPVPLRYPLDDVKGNAFCVSDVYAPYRVQLLAPESHAIGPENINCPNLSQCSLSAYHQV